MTYAMNGRETFDYAPCSYGRSRLVFRGPKKSTEDTYVAVIGGSETYGKFIANPFSDLVEQALGIPVLNLGCQNASLDAFLFDSEVMTLAKGAAVTVLQVMGAQNLSNRFYRVHPRRNDRFLGPSEALRSLFRDIDFTDFSFTRHMLSSLHMKSTDRFGILREELRRAWTARMKQAVKTIDGPVVLLWLREEIGDALGAEPLFVGADMVMEISDKASCVVEVPISRAGGDLDGMVYGAMEAGMASRMLNVTTHHEIADQLLVGLRPCLDYA